MAATMVLFNAGETMVKINFANRLARCRSGEKMHRGATKTAVCMSSSNLRYTSNLRVKCIAGENSSSSTVGRSSSTVGRSDFPKGFMFGAGSSAYQVEGAVAEGGREASIWDTFSHIPGNIADGSTGDIAVDQYNRYKDDVQLLKHLGMDSYRFSISWSRIFPKGSPRHGGVNEEGVAYYQNLITELLNNGIEPFVTLYHWDLPQILEDEYGGFLSEKVVEDFAAFAEECFRRFGDRVKYWLTLNEPLTFATYGYDKGLHAPGRCSQGFGFCKAGNSATEPYIVTHNMLLAHSAAVKIYRTKYQAEQKGSIGIALVVSWMVPFSNSIEDQKAAQRVMDFRMGWYLDPLTKGDYPVVMRDLVGARLPQFTQQQSEDLAGSFDFLGYNYYTSEFTQHNPIPPNPLHTDYFLDACANTAHKFDRLYIGEAEGMDMFRSYPAGLGEVLNYTKNRYNNPPIYITETGYGSLDDGTNSAYEALNDSERVKYHSEHLSYVLQGIREGVDIRGYMVWSFLDNFEWASGTPGRFGLYYVDYANDLQRIPRESANWFRDILKQ